MMGLYSALIEYLKQDGPAVASMFTEANWKENLSEAQIKMCEDYGESLGVPPWEIRARLKM